MSVIAHIYTADGPCDVMSSGMIRITDDTAAKLYLTKHGLLGELLGPDKTLTGLVCETKESYVFASVYRRPGVDTGHFVLIFPKDIFQKAQFVKIIRTTCPNITIKGRTKTENN